MLQNDNSFKSASKNHEAKLAEQVGRLLAIDCQKSLKAVSGVRLKYLPARNRIIYLPVKTKMHFYVYILQSMKDFSFYTGQCEDLDYRMSKHFDGFNKYTASKRPWRLVYFELYNTRSEAIKREKEIKNKKSRKYIIETIASRQRLLRTGG